MSSRIRSEEYQGDTGPARPTSQKGSPLSLTAGHGGLDPPSPGDTGTREGTAHRRVRWGRPSAQKSDSKVDSAPWASAESAHETSIRAPDRFRTAGRPLAARHAPSLATPEGGGESNARGVRGPGSASGSEPRITTSSTSSPARVDLHAAGERKAVIVPPRLGTASRSQQVPRALELRATIRDGENMHDVSVTQADWIGFDHFRHGASPDLIVALCLRQHLGH